MHCIGPPSIAFLADSGSLFQNNLKFKKINSNFTSFEHLVWHEACNISLNKSRNIFCAAPFITESPTEERKGKNFVTQDYVDKLYVYLRPSWADAVPTILIHFEIGFPEEACRTLVRKYIEAFFTRAEPHPPRFCLSHQIHPLRLPIKVCWWTGCMRNHRYPDGHYPHYDVEAMHCVT